MMFHHLLCYNNKKKKGKKLMQMVSTTKTSTLASIVACKQSLYQAKNLSGVVWLNSSFLLGPSWAPLRSLTFFSDVLVFGM